MFLIWEQQAPFPCFQNTAVAGEQRGAGVRLSSNTVSVGSMGWAPWAGWQTASTGEEYSSKWWCKWPDDCRWPPPWSDGQQIFNEKQPPKHGDHHRRWGLPSRKWKTWRTFASRRLCWCHAGCHSTQQSIHVTYWLWREQKKKWFPSSYIGNTHTCTRMHTRERQSMRHKCRTDRAVWQRRGSWWGWSYKTSKKWLEKITFS